jgi:hypothetical protein
MRRKKMIKKFGVAAVLISSLIIGNAEAKEKIPEQKIIEIGEKTSKQLLKTLKSSLLKAMSEGTVYDAVKFCSQKAIPLTKKVEQQIDNGIKIKRTSLKYRNPANAPDTYEKEALLYFEKNLKEKGKLPPYFIQKIKENNQIYYRYYKPLKIGGLCITCHGKPEIMDKKLLKIIKELYPNDRATGYKIGDFRGVVRVSIPKKFLDK